MSTTTTERYPAVVSDNADPEKRGRIRVMCSGLTGDEDTLVPFWFEPVQDWGWFYVPDVGEQVEVEVVKSSTFDEVAGQSFLENPNPTWRGKRHYGGTESDHPTPVHDDFKTHYAKRRGFATPMGHTLVFDDTEGETSVELTWVNKDGKKTRLTMDKDGSAHITVLDEKHDVRLLSTGEFHCTLDGNKHSVDMLADSKLFDVKLDSSKHKIVLDGAGPTFTASLDSDKHKVVLDGAGPTFTASLDSDKHKVVLDGAGGEMKVSVNNDAGKLSLKEAALQVDLGTSQHQLLLNDNKLAAKLGGSDGSNVMKVETPGKMTLGPGTDNAVAYTPFSILWNLVKTHVHPTTAPGAPTLVSPALSGSDPTAAKSGNILMPLG